MTGVEHRTMNRPMNIQTFRLLRGVSLLELVIAMVIASMVLVTLFTLYSQTRRDADAISSILDSSVLPERIQQLIAQDLDRFYAVTDDVTFNLQPMPSGGLAGSSLVMESSIYDGLSQPKTYERIIWLTRLDPESQSMALYRGHSGLVSEDKLLESQRTDEERSQLVPLCSGLTYFKIEAVNQGLAKSTHIGPPPAQVVVSLSFAQPEKRGNDLAIPPEKIVTRTIAVGRLRPVRYIFTDPNLAGPGLLQDVNAPAESRKSPSKQSITPGARP
jgi:type II secretory pathway pseudopilin PulG